MSYTDEKIAPIREDRLGACDAFGGSGCELKKQFAGGCMKYAERGFCQGTICQLLPGTAILNTITDAVVIVHGSIGCGGVGHSQNASLRWRQILDGKTNPRGTLWLSTGLDERDVISGGEAKLEEAILEADKRYRPSAIIVVSTCVPGIIGDDIDGVASKLQPMVSVPILPVHCEGFKTKIMATAYDAIYHSMARNLLEVPEEEEYVLEDELGDAMRKLRNSRTVNLVNVSSMTPGDEQELTRLLKALGLEVNIFPCFTHPESMKYITEAALSVSACPTHDDYLLQHLQEKYGIPYIIGHMPIGIENTGRWLREIAKFFGREDIAERFIAQETRELNEALAPIAARLRGKKAMLSSGEIRTLATAVWLEELGLEVVAVRPYHFDEFGQVDLDKLIAQKGDVEVNVATVQPFETVNIIERTRPDIYLGHNADMVWAAKSGVPTLPIYGGPYTYVGFAGAFDLARRINRALKNPAFNTNLGKNVRQPYYQNWYTKDPYTFIAAGGSEI
jgi:nitrogenase molybdenum-iron protein alpha chain